MSDYEDTLVRLLSARPRFETELALACGLSVDKVTAFLKTDPHRFKRTGLIRLAVRNDHEWSITDIFKAEQYGRKSVPRR